MRLDVLTLAAVLFVFGLFVSSIGFGLSDLWPVDERAPAPHQQGFLTDTRS